MTAYTLNLADLTLTLYALDRGGVELNPLMQSVPFMVFYKTVIVDGLLWWLTTRQESIAKQGLIFLTLVYAIYCLGHLIFILGVI